MQLRELEGVAIPNSEGLWCNDEVQHTDQTVLKICAVKLVDIRKLQGLHAHIIAEENILTGGNTVMVHCLALANTVVVISRRFLCVSKVPGESSMFDGNQETPQARLKMNSRRLVGYGKEKAEGDPQDGAFDHEYNDCDFMPLGEYIQDFSKITPSHLTTRTKVWYLNHVIFFFIKGD